ncbi:MAG: ABC transporter permease, partial [Burkholderiaceae bacterium]
MLALLRELSWPELRHHAWRHLSAWFAVVLGVALAYAVHLINESALGEFSAAVRSVNGQPDFELRESHRSFGGGFDEALYARVAAHPGVAVASPALEIETYAQAADGKRVMLRVIGLDALVAPLLSPQLLPRPAATADRFSVLDPAAVFFNASASRVLGESGVVRLGSGSKTVALQVAGHVAASGPPLAVMDIAGAQAAFGMLGRISRIDVRLASGVQADAVLRELALPSSLRAASPDESALRVSNLSRAYRVNLNVLALVALFTGAFLVYSILSLSVAQRTPQLALLGVLGLGARARLNLVLAESAFLGLAGSVAGLALGFGLAALALKLLAGDLGGGYFPGIAGVLPVLRVGSTGIGVASVYALLGVAAAVAGGWFPARAAQRIAPALALKGFAASNDAASSARWALGAMLGAALLALAPPWGGLPLAAYASVALLLVGGIAGIPSGVALLLRTLPALRGPLVLLALERARQQRHQASTAVAGIVASLALAVALTVMVGSFRGSVTTWLGQVLPADLYARTASSGAGADTLYLSGEMLQAVQALPSIAKAVGQRTYPALFDPARPSAAVLARPLGDATTSLPLVGALLPPLPGVLNVYVSEAFASLYGAAQGSRLDLPLPDGRTRPAYVRGVWRDYARQHGAVALDSADYQAASGDTRINDLALWLAPGAEPAQVQEQIALLIGTRGALEFFSAGELRATSLRIFDRSFAVTVWLQGVAIGIGLFGIAASFAAQVLARRKEFGALMHLGLTRSQVLRLVALEGAFWSSAAALLGSLLGLGVSVVLVKVVNPQSFHWTMELAVPWARLALLALGVVACATLTAWLAARACAGANMALLVKQDWS